MSEPRSVGPRWRITRDEAATLELTRLTSSEWRRSVGALLVGLGCWAGAAGLFAVTPDTLVLVFWPLAIGLLGVGVLAFVGALRSVLQATRGMSLVFSADGVRGVPLPRGLGLELGAMVTAPKAEVAKVRLHRAAHPPLTLSLLEVELRDGRRLQGPEVAWPASERDPLEPVARAAAKVLDLTLIID
jgi:hypothetical protein